MRLVEIPNKSNLRARLFRAIKLLIPSTQCVVWLDANPEKNGAVVGAAMLRLVQNMTALKYVFVCVCVHVCADMSDQSSQGFASLYHVKRVVLSMCTSQARSKTWMHSDTPPLNTHRGYLKGILQIQCS